MKLTQWSQCLQTSKTPQQTWTSLLGLHCHLATTFTTPLILHNSETSHYIISSTSKILMNPSVAGYKE